MLDVMHPDPSKLRSPEECMELGEGSTALYVYTNSLVASILLLLTGENLEPITDNEKVVQTGYLLAGERSDSDE